MVRLFFVVRIDRATLRRNRQASDVLGGNGDPFRWRCYTPRQTWLFEYASTAVTCGECHDTFPHTELQSKRLHSNDGEEFQIPNICPKCGAQDCCELRWEKPPKG